MRDYQGDMHAVPTEQLRALVNLLWPDEITPTAKRMLLAAADQHDQCVESVDPDGKPNGYCRRCFKDMPTRQDKINAAAERVADQIEEYL